MSSPVLIVPRATAPDWARVWSPILFHMSGGADIHNLIRCLFFFFWWVDQLCLWSHFTLLKCIWLVCVPQGFYQMHHDNLSCSALTAPSKTEGLILHQWWLRKVSVCATERQGKREKGQKTALKKQNECEEVETAVDFCTILALVKHETFLSVFCAYDPGKLGLKLGYLIPMCVNSPVCVYVVNKPAFDMLKGMFFTKSLVGPDITGT